MPSNPKAPIVPSDTVEINNTMIRCQKARCLVDAIDVVSMVTNTASSAERLVWSKFKLTNPGVYRFKWDLPCSGLGRIVVRADQLSQELRQMHRGKSTTCIKVAEELDVHFPGANLVSQSQMDLSIPVEEIDTSNGTIVPSVQTIVPSTQMIQSSVCKEIAQLACSHFSDGDMQDYGKEMLERQKSVLDHQAEHTKGMLNDQRQHAKDVLDDKRIADKIYHKMTRAREMGDVELERELKRRFIEA